MEEHNDDNESIGSELDDAVKRGTIAQVQQVLPRFTAQHPRDRSWNERYNRVYESALRRGDLAIIRPLVEDAHGGNANFAPGYFGDPPLYIASRQDNEAVFDFLLSRGANVNHKANYGDTALHRAVRNGNMTMVKKLVDAGADLYGTTPYQTHNTPYDEALETERADIAEYLLEVYCDRILEGHDGPLVIHHFLQDVSKMNNFKLRHYATVNYNCEIGRNTFRIRVGCLTISRMNVMLDALLSRQPNALQTRNEHGELPIHRALRLHYEDSMIRLLLQRSPGHIRERDCRGNMPIHIACEQCYLWPTIRRLIRECPASLFEENGDGKLPIHIACGNPIGQEVDTLNELIDANNGSKALRTHDGNGDLPIHSFCQRHEERFRYERGLQILVDRDPGTLQVENNHGELPFHCACRTGLPLEAVQVLLEHFAAAVQERDDSQNLPVHLACLSTNAPLAVVMLLVEDHPASLRAVNGMGDSPLHCACRTDKGSPEGPEDDGIVFDEGDTEEDDDDDEEERKEREAQQQRRQMQVQFEKVLFLLEHGGPDSLRVENSTERALPLHLLCAVGPPLDLVKLMIKSAPETVDSRTRYGFTPFQMACRASSLDVIYELVRASAERAGSLQSDGAVVEGQVAVPVHGKRKRKRTNFYAPK